MCQEKPGPRCFRDSTKTVESLSKRVAKAEKAVEAAQEGLSQVASASTVNLNDYTRQKKVIDRAEAKLRALSTELRYAQRDVDGTPKGRKQLEAEMSMATSASQLRALEDRVRQADMARVVRVEALRLKKSGVMPAIRFAA